MASGTSEASIRFDDGGRHQCEAIGREDDAWLAAGCEEGMRHLRLAVVGRVAAGREDSSMESMKKFGQAYVDEFMQKFRQLRRG